MARKNQGDSSSYSGDASPYGGSRIRDTRRDASGRDADAGRLGYDIPSPEDDYQGQTEGANPPTQTSRAASRPVGVRPVTAQDYERGTLGYAYPDGSGKTGGSTRRAFVAGGAAIGVVALLGVGAGLWWTHRAVACEVNGTERTVTIGTTAQELLDRGYASPKAGNLMSIADSEGNTTLLEQGGGNPYTLMVNDAERDPASYKVADGDVIEFIDGTDATEESTKQETPIPCTVQFRSSSEELMDPADASAQGIFLAPIGCVAQWGKDGVSTVETGNVSGITIDRGVTQEAKNLIIAAQRINPVGDKPLVALTFDDGPDPDYTPQYLDILASYGVKATFFNIGTSVEAYPELSQRVVAEGHQIASHTYSHSDLLTLSAEEVTSEITRTFDVIEAATGVRTAVVRPPYGNFYCKQFLQNLGLISYSAYWSVDSEDWAVAESYSASAGTADVGAAQIVSNVTGALSGSNYNGAVILMHDGGGDRSCDVAALPTIIETFLNAGYGLVTMNDLLKADPTIPAWVGGDDPAAPADSTTPDLTPYTT